MHRAVSQQDIFAGFFYCAIIFSALSIRFFTFGGNYFPEIAVITCILCHSFFRDIFFSDFIESISSGKNFIYCGGLLLAFLGFLGAVRGGDLLNSYAEFRSLLFFVCGLWFVIFEVGRGRADIVILLATISSVCGLFDWVFGQIFPSNAGGVKYAGPIYSAAVAGVLSALGGREKEFYISILVAFLCAVIGFYRQYWIVAGAVAIFGIFCGRLRLLTSGVGVLGILTSIIVYIFAISWFNEVVNSNESMYIQSVGKTNDLMGFIDGTLEQTESDALRQGYFIFLLTHPLETFFPFGLGSRAVYGNVSNWFDQYLIPANTLDSVWFYSSFHFGSLLTLVFVFILARGWINFSKKIGWLAGCSFLVCMMAPVFFDGGALTVLPRAFWLGALFGINFGFVAQPDLPTGDRAVT